MLMENVSSASSNQRLTLLSEGFHLYYPFFFWKISIQMIKIRNKETFLFVSKQNMRLGSLMAP